ncbi:MAG: hypothetical protein ACOYON_16190 [Fimbriimonas sp.]
MDHWELNPIEDPEASLADLAERQGLVLTRHDLKQYPGGQHWHLQKPKQKGTLEVTWWPARGRFWMNQHPRRDAEWIAPIRDEILRTHGQAGTSRPDPE